MEISRAFPRPVAYIRLQISSYLTFYQASPKACVPRLSLSLGSPTHHDHIQSVPYSQSIPPPDMPPDHYTSRRPCFHVTTPAARLRTIAASEFGRTMTSNIHTSTSPRLQRAPELHPPSSISPHLQHASRAPCLHTSMSLHTTYLESSMPPRHHARNAPPELHTSMPPYLHIPSPAARLTRSSVPRFVTQ